MRKWEKIEDEKVGEKIRAEKFGQKENYSY